MEKSVVLDELVRMSLSLGRPEMDYVILGEGNTSAKVDDESFYIKASGAQLCRSTRETFVEVKSSKIIDLLDGPDLIDEDIKERLLAARVDKTSPRPSVETVFHAYLLTLPNVRFIGHTHPTAVNTILCSNAAEDIVKSRIFPDEIVYCGLAPLFIPYVDPGLPLARGIRFEVQKYMDTEGEVPKVILMQNHGLIALGAGASDVEAITAMWVKTARILTGAYLLGGIHPLSQDSIDRIHTRPDEEYRRRMNT